MGGTSGALYSYALFSFLFIVPPEMRLTIYAFPSIFLSALANSLRSSAASEGDNDDKVANYQVWSIAVSSALEVLYKCSQFSYSYYYELARLTLYPFLPKP